MYLVIPSLLSDAEQLQIKELLNAATFTSGKITATELSEMKYPSGRAIGKDNAKNIIAGARLRKTHLKILGSIKGISPESAELILDAMDGDLCNFDDLTRRSVSNIKRANGKKLGMALANRLFKMLEPDTE